MLVPNPLMGSVSIQTTGTTALPAIGGGTVPLVAAKPAIMVKSHNDPLTNYDPRTDTYRPVGEASVREVLTARTAMYIQVTPIENGYVVAIAKERISIPRLIYATDLTDVGHQITAFGVTQKLEDTGAKT